MVELRINGSSDDTIGAYGLKGYGYAGYSFDTGESGAMDDYDTCASNDPPMTFRIEAGGERCRVTAIYDGCWSFAFGLVEEEDAIPEWLASARMDREDYSVGWRLTLPDDAKVVWEVGRRRE